MTIRMNLRLGAILAATLVVSACGGGGESATSSTTMSPEAAQLPPFNYEIRTLSNRARRSAGRSRAFSAPEKS